MVGLRSHKALTRRLAALSAVAGLFIMAGCGQAPAPTADSASSSSSNSSQAKANPDLDVKAYDALIKSGPVADDATVSANKWASEVKKAGVLKIGSTKTSTLFSLQSPDDNQVRGFDAGLSQLLARYIIGDAKTELTVVDSSTRESVLQNGTVNAVFATYSITPERKQKIDFAGPYYTSQQAVLVSQKNTDIKSVKDLSGKKVAVQAGSTGPDVVAKNAPKAEVQEFQTNDEILQALRQGRVDAYVVDETLLLGNIVKNPGEFKIAGDAFGAEDPYGIGLPKDSDAAAFVDDFLTKVEKDGTWAKLWKIAIGDRTGISEAPEPPTLEK